MRALNVKNILRSQNSSNLKGVVVSRGDNKHIITGKARIVSTLEDIRKFQEGEILITAGTDFHLLEVMRKASAIITVEGGVLSHAAVVSREFRIPCVVGVVSALDSIQSGNLVSVDINDGTISVVREDLNQYPTFMLRPVPNSDGRSVGKKAAMLLQVQSLGINVAPFVMLGEEFFNLWLDSVGIPVTEFRNTPFTYRKVLIEELQPTTQIIDYLQPVSVAFKEQMLAIRSSAPFEDASAHSYAGILTSRLFIESKPIKMAIAIKDCWSALFTPNFVEYAGDFQQADVWFIPLIVQQMVAAKVSGVLFTHNPVTNKNRMIMELIEGGCFEITDGTSHDERIEWGIRENPMSTLLSNNEVLQLQQTISLLKNNIGNKLDIEFSFDKTGKLFIHQVRPITSI